MRFFKENMRKQIINFGMQNKGERRIVKKRFFRVFKIAVRNSKGLSLL